MSPEALTMSLLSDPTLASPLPAARLARAGWTYDLEPVFLVGCPRSGTTWLQAMLAELDGVYTGPETHFFHVYRSVLAEYRRSEGTWFGFSRYLGEDQLAAFLAESFWLLVSGLPAPERRPRVFLEKTPDHVLDAEWILRAFPEARFIHLVRDPRSVASSLLRGSQGWAADWAPTTATDAACMWAERVRAGRALRERLGEERCLELRYEDACAAPEQTLESLARWLGVTATPDRVRAAAEAHRLENRQPGSHFGSIPNFRNLPEGFVGPASRTGAEAELDAARRALVQHAAADEMALFGYPAPSRATAGAPALTETEKDATVLLVGEGDEPGPLLEGLGRMSADWQPGWELVLTPASGRACELAGTCLGGDFRVLSREADLPWGAALNRGAAAARAPYLILPTPRGLFRISRDEFFRQGGAPEAEAAEAWAWIAWKAEARPDLLPSLL